MEDPGHVIDRLSRTAEYLQDLVLAKDKVVSDQECAVYLKEFPKKRVTKVADPESRKAITAFRKRLAVLLYLMLVRRQLRRAPGDGDDDAPVVRIPTRLVTALASVTTLHLLDVTTTRGSRVSLVPPSPMLTKTMTGVLYLVTALTTHDPIFGSLGMALGNRYHEWIRGRALLTDGTQTQVDTKVEAASASDQPIAWHLTFDSGEAATVTNAIVTLLNMNQAQTRDAYAAAGKLHGLSYVLEAKLVMDAVHPRGKAARAAPEWLVAVGRVQGLPSSWPSLVMETLVRLVATNESELFDEDAVACVQRLVSPEYCSPATVARLGKVLHEGPALAVKHGLRLALTRALFPDIQGIETSPLTRRTVPVDDVAFLVQGRHGPAPLSLFTRPRTVDARRVPHVTLVKGVKGVHQSWMVTLVSSAFNDGISSHPEWVPMGRGTMVQHYRPCATWALVALPTFPDSDRAPFGHCWDLAPVWGKVGQELVCSLPPWRRPRDAVPRIAAVRIPRAAQNTLAFNIKATSSKDGAEVYGAWEPIAFVVDTFSKQLATFWTQTIPDWATFITIEVTTGSGESLTTLFSFSVHLVPCKGDCAPVPYDAYASAMSRVVF